MSFARLKDRLRPLAALLAEQRCLFCANPTHAEGKEGRLSGLCPDCLARLPCRPPFRFAFCRRCGELIYQDEERSGESAVCAACLLSPPPWENFYFYGPYQGYLRALLLQLKFGQALHLAEGLGSLPAALFTGSAAGWSGLVPMPLHPSRLRERGFNQAGLLAAPLVRILKIPLCQKLLRRRIDSRHQSGLSRAQRRANTRGIFAAGPEARGRSLLLLDDIMTTGATLRSAAACLLEAGAARVDVAVIARTVGRNWRE